MASGRVACIPAFPLLLARLRDALGSASLVQPFPDTIAALPSILRGEIRCTVIAVDGIAHAQSIEAIRSIRHMAPSHAIVAWCEPKALSTRQLLDVAQAGVAEIVLRDVDDMRHVLAGTLNAATQRSHAGLIFTRLADEVPPAMRPLFQFALDHSHLPLDLERVAAAFGVTRQTLRNRLLGHGLPLPRTFMTWCRLLVAASMLEESGHTLDSVGWQLDFSSGHHLGTVLRRYVGTGIAELRETGVLTTVESAFRNAVRTRPARPMREARTRDSLPQSSLPD